MSNLEVLVANYNNYSEEFMEQIFNGSLELNLQGVNVYGISIENTLNLNNFLKINLCLDLPYSRNSTFARKALVASYLEKYPYIETINMGIQISHLDYPDKIAHDLSDLTSSFKNTEFRIFVDFNNFEDFEEVIAITDIIEQNGASEVLFGTRYRKFNLSDLIIDANQLQKSVSIPVGFFGYIKDPDLMKSLTDNFSSVLVPPEMLFRV